MEEEVVKVAAVVEVEVVEMDEKVVEEERVEEVRAATVTEEVTEEVAAMLEEEVVEEVVETVEEVHAYRRGGRGGEGQSDAAKRQGRRSLLSSTIEA